MFEGLQERIGSVGDALLEWVDVDRARGVRHEQLIKAIELNTRESQRRVIVPFSWFQPNGTPLQTQQLARVPLGEWWEITYLSIRSSAQAASAGALELYRDSVDNNNLMLATAVAQNSGVAGTGPGRESVWAEQQTLLVAQYDIGGGTAGDRVVKGSMFCIAHTVKPTIELDESKNNEAKGQHEGRPTENKINFGRPEIPDERGTQSGDAQPAVPALSGIPSGLNGAPVAPKS